MKLEAIRHNGTDYPAARCERCGVLIHPPSGMELHTALHELKDAIIEPNIKSAQRAFRKMRG